MTFHDRKWLVVRTGDKYLIAPHVECPRCNLYYAWYHNTCKGCDVQGLPFHLLLDVHIHILVHFHAIYLTCISTKLD